MHTRAFAIFQNFFLNGPIKPGEVGEILALYGTV
jgi:hypothetical protein